MHGKRFFCSLLLCSVCFSFIGCKPSYVPNAEQTQGSASPTVTHTPEPTPTADPLDAIFAKEGEEIVVYKANGQEIDPYAKGAPLPDYWLYNSYNLRVEIIQHINTEEVMTYYVADIRFRNDMHETSGFGGKKAPGSGRNKPNKLARYYGAVFAQNGDYLIHQEKELKGILIRDGVIYNEGTKEDTLAFMPDGSLKLFAPGETTAQALVDQGVKTTYSFGPILVQDGKVNEQMRNLRGINNNRNPRSGIGMVEPGHLISIVVEGRLPRSKGIPLKRFAELFVEQGCTLAYNLDGGASASMVFLGNMCNSTINDGDVYLGPRPMVDMIIFGSSEQCPPVGGKEYHSGTLVGNGATKKPASTATPVATPTPVQ